MGRLIIVFLLSYFWAVGAYAGGVSIPDGFVVFERGSCRFVVRPVNEGVIGELEKTCTEALPAIFMQLGLNQGDVLTSQVEIRIVPDPIQMADVAPPQASPPDWAGAVAYPNHNLIVLSLRHSSGMPVERLDVILEHELSHLALRRALKNASVPRWFSEGVAIQQSERSSLGRFWVLWQAAQGDQLLSLEVIARYPDTPGAVTLAYAQAADFVGFLIRKHGWMSVRVLVRKLAGGMSFDESFLIAFSTSQQEAEGQWRSGLTGQWRLLPLLTGSGALWGGIVVLFLYATVVVRLRKRERFEAMDEEERALDELAGWEPGRPHRSWPVENESVKVVSKIRVDGDIHTLH